MKAMTDKANDTIQVIVTTVCDRECSECTQLLPWRTDYKHMSPAVFREAVHSLQDWPGIVGIFGGNPCTHPKFPELMAILCEEIPDQRHRGIWTNNVLKHGELVRKVFYPTGRFNVNFHGDRAAYDATQKWIPGKVIPGSEARQSMHSTMLATWQDMGLTEAQWIAQRERCDINQNWSGAIAERDGKAYGYFCEVASSLDGIRGENHGVPVADGWWRQKMPAFAHQVRECCDRGCAVPLRLKGRMDNAETYDVSKTWAERLGKPKGHVKVEVLEAIGAKARESTDYLRLRGE